jgi:hypothetical protein
VGSQGGVNERGSERSRNAGHERSRGDDGETNGETNGETISRDERA